MKIIYTIPIHDQGDNNKLKLISIPEQVYYTVKAEYERITKTLKKTEQFIIIKVQDELIPTIVPRLKTKK